MSPPDSATLDEANPAASPVDTTIVLATCSRAALLRGALESLLTQDWMDTHTVEFVVVDDGSTDHTPAVLREFAANAASRTPAMRVTAVAGERTGIAAARNLGFRAATGTWLASFDDDQLASPGWLRALRERAERSGALCVGGALTLHLPEGVDLAQFGTRTRGVLGEHLPGSGARPYRGGNDLPATNNVLLRRDVFTSAGPFDPRFTEGGEDKDLFRRVLACGHSLWFEPAALAEHITPPARIAESNIRWTCLRLGASDARVRLTSGGVFAGLRLAVLRCGVALLRDIPALLAAKLRHKRCDQLEMRCSLWYTEGVLRALPELLSPEHSRQVFLRSLDFRQRNGERAERTRVKL